MDTVNKTSYHIDSEQALSTKQQIYKIMLLDWTQYSRFVSNQVRDKCIKGSTAANLEAGNQFGSINFPNISAGGNRGSTGSISKPHITETSAMGSSLESGLDVGDLEVFNKKDEMR